MKHSNIFSFCNQKGGVGKTTTAINIATSVSIEGYNVIVVDIDPQANATSGLGEDKIADLPTVYQVLLGEVNVESAVRTTKIPRLSIISSNSELSGAEIELISLPEREFCLKRALDPVREKFDYLFIDCPPSLGLLTVNALTASDFILIPLQCEYYALEGLGQLLQTHTLVKKSLNPDLEIGAVLLTMADFRTRLTEQVIHEVRNYFKEKVFDIVIPRSVRLGEAPSFGIPGVMYDKISRGSKSYVEAAEEFLRKFPCEKRSESKTEEIKQREEEIITRGENKE